MKNILLIIARFELGGIPTQSLKWAIYLKKNGYNPIILAESVNDKTYIDLLEKNGIQYGILKTEIKKSSIKFVQTLRYYSNLIDQINKFNPFAILPFNKWLAYNICLIWRFTSAKKCYFMERNSGIEYNTTLLGNITRYLSVLNSSGLIYNSKSATSYSRFPEKTYVVKNSFEKPKDIEFVKESYDYNSDMDHYVILHVANLGGWKNYDLIIAGWKQLKAEIPNAQLLVIGSDLNGKNSKTIEGLKQQDIIYLGSQYNVNEYINNADLCVHSAFHEGCPNVILEYMFEGKVIVASDIPSIREVLTEENHPLLFNNNSVDDFVEKVKAAKGLSEEEANLMRSSNLKKLKSDYSDENFSKILEIIEK